MIIYRIACVLFAFGLIGYATALIDMGSRVAEISSDIANGNMLTAAVLLLLRLTKKQIQSQSFDRK